ncbi:LptF/LptG family permease [Deinococcus arcticus]|uniref:YjgP/YjgQ family permease n=1 Tax=Deinococcus arcticus TaxID=2136176 RepID=A0A2T3W6R5_9DEIO|nr:LptF/LptG family permease [Deinococcus arcticus]PTA67591.1 YjgP/YjgQ family permease [Deinococcus arcticus]
MKTFERYVLSEILPFLAGGVAAVITLLLLASLEGIIAPLLAKGANPVLVARVLALSVPEATARALPIALMFAVLLGLSRLAADSEIKSAVASGIPAARLFRPVLGLGAAVAVLAFALGEGLVPRARVEARAVQRQIVLDNPRVLGLGQNVVLRDTLNRAISVGEVRPGGELRDLRIVTMVDGTLPSEVITAAAGRLRPGTNVLELRQGQRVTYQNGDPRPSTILSFKQGRLPLQDTGTDLGGQPQTAQPIYDPLPVLWSRTQTYRQQKISAPADFTALHQKFAGPLAALALAFFAVTLAVYSFRSGRDLGLVWALLLTFAYYATYSVFRVMGENGAVPGAVAAYAPDVIAVVAGAGLLWLTSRR